MANTGSKKRQRTEISHGGLGKFFTRAFNGVNIRQRDDGYIDGTAMCKVGKGKKMNAWRMNKTTNLYLEALSAATGPRHGPL